MDEKREIARIIEALTILEPYGSPVILCAEHDAFYAYRLNRSVAQEDAAKLKELGWFLDDESGGTGWMCFV